MSVSGEGNGARLREQNESGTVAASGGEEAEKAEKTRIGFMSRQVAREGGGATDSQRLGAGKVAQLDWTRASENGGLPSLNNVDLDLSEEKVRPPLLCVDRQQPSTHTLADPFVHACLNQWRRESKVRGVLLLTNVSFINWC